MNHKKDPKGLIPPLGNLPVELHGSLGHVSFTPYGKSGPQDHFKDHGGSVADAVVQKEIPPEVKKLVALKQSEYAKKANTFRMLHYILLSWGAILGILTPILIPALPYIAQWVSVAVVVVISIDQIFRPKDKWSLYSKATDLIQLQLFKKAGVYEENKELIDTIINTELEILTTVPGLNDALRKIAENSPTNK